MSGYLPPHSMEGPQSSLVPTDYDLRIASIHGEDGSGGEYWLTLPPDVVPTTKTLITIGPKEKPLLKYNLGGYDQNLNDDSVRDAWRTIFEHSSIAMLDTAEHYGYTDGYSEKSIGRNWALDTEEGKADRSKIVYATKYLPTPWRHPWQYPDIVLNAFRGSLERTKLGDIDIYQIHGPSHFGVWPRLDTLLDSLAKAYALGHIKAIGTCNFGFDKVKYVYTRLKQRNVPLVSNQVEFSLLRQDPWSAGLIEKCHKLGIITIAYSPLAVGRLTGKYSSSKPPRGNRNFGDLAWAKIQPIVDELSRIGAKEGKTPTAVALNWVVCKGAIPIPGVKNGAQVKDCLQAMGWRLSKEDEGRLDLLGLTNSWDWNLLKHFQNWWWQQG